MIIKQFHTDPEDGASSYLMVDEVAGSAAVVNPRGDVGPYIDEARALGANIRQVLMTHFHQDFLAAYRELHSLVGVSVLQGPRARSSQDARDQGLQPLGIEEFRGLVRGGAQILDVRLASEFARTHLRGALNIGLDGELARWAGTFLEHEFPILIVADPGTEGEAAARLTHLGLGPVAGYLRGGMKAATGRTDLLETARESSVQVLARRLQEGEPPLVVDVRDPSQFDAGHIPGALSIPLTILWDRAGELPMGRELAIISGHGYRSSVALSLLMAEGITTAWHVRGGMEAWEARGLPMKSMTPARPCARTPH